MLTIPNLLTMSRIFAVPLLVALLWLPRPFEYLLAFGLYVLIAFTDWLDGFLARKLGTVSRLGAFLDPIADKIMVAAVLLMLVSTRSPDQAPLIGGIHIVAAIIILLREIMVSGLREYLAGSQVSVPVSQLAKWKTTFQMIALGALILAGGVAGAPWILWAGLASLWAAAVLTVVTGWDYLRIGLRHMA
jgi:CDP-diacylglycerol--glycerol-3-phosphate 3-phosphatidyltransferase/cardiolipin synthase